MRKMNPDKIFIPAPPSDSSCACNDCQFMKMITLKKIYLSLKNNRFEISLNEEIRQKAERPIRRMLELSQQLGF